MNRHETSTGITLLAKLLIIFMIILVIFTILTTIASAKGNIYIGDQIFITSSDQTFVHISYRIEGSGNIIFGDTISGPIGVVETSNKVYSVAGNLWIDSDGSNH